ncbi:MAG: hypothetical protein J6T10_05380 [Methanobrevibacter sp.]|nr:hypothetical protein [Methanobrevibacter sp.]
MSQKSKKKNIVKKGRPKNPVIEDSVVNETTQERLDMSDEKNVEISIEATTKKWKDVFTKIAQINTEGSGLTTSVAKWNKLNPFLQNQRIKNLYTTAKTYNKTNISTFLADPANHETELRGLGWANSSSQQIYYNILRRSADIPIYNYFVIPELFDEQGEYKNDNFKTENILVEDWLSLFNIPNTFKTIAMEVKREGKSSYLLRNKFLGEGKNKKPGFCTLQKMPTEWVKITGKGQLGFTISFNMLYFLNIANNPSDFGEFMEKAWEDMITSGVVVIDEKTGKKTFNADKAKNYKFSFGGNQYTSSIEILSKGKQQNYLFWLRMPFDICYTFGSDNSHPWVAPDTMGLMLKLQELTDYGQLAGLIASTPLTAVLTGEIETIPNPRAGKNESVYAPEVLEGYMTQFNQATSTNVEAWLWPAKNIKLQQLSADVNSSDILSEATQNFVETAGEGGLTIVTDKPNVAQVNVAKQLAASQQRYVTLQFNNVMNYILQHKLGFRYKWKINIWGDIFNIENDKKFLKEIVANGNMALLPKLMSAEGITMIDTKAIVEYIKTLDFYKDFVTYTQLKNAELGRLAQKENEQNKLENGEESKSVGRPKIPEQDIDNDNTASSVDRGVDGADGREKA